MLSVSCHSKSFNSASCAVAIIESLSERCKITKEKKDFVLCFTKDSVSYNKVTSELLQEKYNNSIEIECISHKLNNCGEKFQLNELESFYSLFINLHSHSFHARKIFFEHIGKTLKTNSKTR